jgi:hypothetical protein
MFLVVYKVFFFKGDIVSFWANTGFMFDIAPLFQAMVVFCEHVRIFQWAFLGVF